MDAVLREAGECGRFQGLHLLFTQLPRFVIAWAVFLMMFGGLDPGWICVKTVNSTTSGLPYTNNTNRLEFTTILNDLESTDITTGFIHTYNTTAEMNPGDQRNLTEDRHINVEGSCAVIDSCDDIIFNAQSVTVVSRFALVCDREWILKCIMIVQGVGFFTGALIGGQLGECFGRKIGLYSSTFLMCVACGVAVFSTSWVMYAACIFFVGLGANGVISLVTVYSMEFLNSKWRGYFGSLPTWNISLLLFTLTTALVKNWIYLHIITSSLALISCLGFFLVVESPRWLVMNGHPEKAKEAVRKIARINKKPEPNHILDKIKEPKRRSLIVEDTEGLSTQPKVDGSKTGSYTYWDLFKNQEVRIVTIKLATIMTAFGVIYFAFGFGVKSLPGDFYFNAIVSSVCEILNLFLVGPLCNKVGRRGAGIIMSLIGLLSCVAIVLAVLLADENNSAQSTVIKSFAFIGKAVSQGTFIIGSLCLVEMVPTVVRNVGIGFCRCGAGLGTLIAPFLIPSSEPVSFSVCFSMLGVLFGVQIALYFSLDETNKLDLKDGFAETETVITVGSDLKHEHCVGEEKENSREMKQQVKLPDEESMIT